MDAVSSLPATNWGNSSVSPSSPTAPPGVPGQSVGATDSTANPQDVFISSTNKPPVTNNSQQSPVNPDAFANRGASPFTLPPSSIASLPPNLGNYYSPAYLPRNPNANPNDNDQQQNNNQQQAVDYDNWLHEGARHLQNMDASQILANVHRL